MTPSELLAVGLLLTLLESPSFRTREDAYRSLDSMGQKAVPAMIAARPAAGRDAQQKLTSLIDKRHGQWWAGFIGVGEAIPWLDSLPDDYPDRHEIIWGYLHRSDAADYAPLYAKYRCATVLFVRDMIADGKAVEVGELLSLMRKRCAKWDGHGHPPPEEK